MSENNDDDFTSGLSTISEFVQSRMVDGDQITDALDAVAEKFPSEESETYLEAASEVLGYMMNKGREVSLFDFFIAVDKRTSQLASIGVSQ